MQQYIIMGAKGAGNPVGFMGSLYAYSCTKPNAGLINLCW